LVKLLKKAGLTGAKVGVESFDENVLKDAERYTVTKDEQLEKISMLHSNGIRVSAMYILGYPEDTEDTVTKTIDYAKKLNTYYAQFSIWTPYPGTPIYKKMLSKVYENKLEKFNQYNLTFKHDNFDQKKLRFYLSKAYSEYYFRPKWIINNIFR